MSPLACRAVPDAIAEVLGGEASEATRLALTAHQVRCQRCAALGAGLAEVLERTRTLQVPEAVPGYDARFRLELRRRLSQPPAPWARFTFGIRVLAGGSALALLVLLMTARSGMRHERTGLALAPPVPLARGQLTDARDLARAIDPIGGDDLLDFGEIAPWEGLPAEPTSRAPSGDLFAFLDDAAPLSEEEMRALLQALHDAPG